MESLGNVERCFFDGPALLWNFQLFDVDGSPITLGKVLIGLFLAVAAGGRAALLRLLDNNVAVAPSRFFLEKMLVAATRGTV